MTDTPTVNPPLAFLDAHPLWHVFPVRCGEKYPPCFENNLELASNDRATIKSWAKDYPGCNWGLSLKKSHLIVMDVDTKHGKVGRETLERLELEHGPLPRTFEVRTPSGGRHLYFSETAHVKHRMRVSAFGRDCDSTNYVLLPGSVLDVGRYTLAVKAPIAPAPAWFAEYLDAPMVGDNSQVPAVEQDTPNLIAWAIHHLKHDAPPAIEGRNGEFTLLMVAARLKDHGISEHKAIELLLEFYNDRCSPPWSIEGATADRLNVKVANAWKYLKQTQPGAHTAEADFGDDSIDAAGLDALTAWWKERDKAAADAKAKKYRLVKRFLKQTVPTKSTLALWKANK